MPLGSKTMLMGPTGVGKTTALKTLSAAGITPFAIFTEPSFDVIADTDPKTFHWMYIPPANNSFDDLLASAKKVNTLTYERLAEQKPMDKSKYSQFLKVISALGNFKCDRTGEEFGAVDSWGDDRCIVIDSLSGLSIMARGLTVGDKPTLAPGEWNIAQYQIETLMYKLTTACPCHLVVVTHLERETDEVAGTTRLMASTLGRKLAPKLPYFFSDVVLAQRDGLKFTWSTAAVGVDLKARNLRIADGLTPSFEPLIEAWRKRYAANDTQPKAAFAAK